MKSHVAVTPTIVGLVALSFVAIIGLTVVVPAVSAQGSTPLPTFAFHCAHVESITRIGDGTRVEVLCQRGIVFVADADLLTNGDAFDVTGRVVPVHVAGNQILVLRADTVEAIEED